MFLLLFGVWLILNGRVTAEIVVLGLIIAALLVAFSCRFMNYSIKKELLMYRLAPWAVRYFWVLVQEIAKANLSVLKLVLSPDQEPEPALFYFESGLRTEIGRVILSDSITLTPGTMTATVEGDRFCVHCLDRTFADGIENSVFLSMLEDMESLWLGEKADEGQKKEAAEWNR